MLWGQRIIFEDLWSQLKAVSESVITLTCTEKELWTKSIMDVHALCTAVPVPFTKQLYYEVKNFLEQHVKMLCEQIRNSVDMLKQYEKTWVTYAKGIEYLNTLYVYFNCRNVLTQKPTGARFYDESSTVKMLEVRELGMEIWMQNVMEPLKECIIESLLDAIRKSRSGIETDYAVLDGVIKSFITTDSRRKKTWTFYGLFEELFLYETEEYYRLQVSKLMQENDCVHFMREVFRLHDEENRRIIWYLKRTSFEKVHKLCETVLFEKNQKYLHKESKLMLQEGNIRGLRLMYQMLSRISGALDKFTLNLQQHITKDGHMVLNSLGNDVSPQVFVESANKFFKKYEGFIIETFHSNEQMLSALHKACSDVFNCEENTVLAGKCPELLSKYCDSFLRKQPEGLSEAEIEHKLFPAIKIFTFINDKDMFQKLYSRALLRRLINGTSTSMDSEELMIKKLKDTCGPDFTKSMHRMFTDVTVSKALSKQFMVYLKDNCTDLELNFCVNVLQMGSLPVASTPPHFVVPQAFERSLQEFAAFYNTRFDGRKLTWHHYLGNGEIKLCYLRKPCTVVMTTYQMSILLLFEKVDYLSFSEIQQSTELENDLLVRNIEGLVDSKLLLSADESGIMNRTYCLIKLNLEYTTRRKKVKIPHPRLKKESELEVQKMHKSVEDERKLQLQAAIVSVLKSRKQIKRNDLIEEVIKQVNKRFVPKIPMIEKCICILIEKEYIGNSTECPDTFVYL